MSNRLACARLLCGPLVCSRLVCSRLCVDDRRAVSWCAVGLCGYLVMCCSNVDDIMPICSRSGGDVMVMCW